MPWLRCVVLELNPGWYHAKGMSHTSQGEEPPRANDPHHRFALFFSLRAAERVHSFSKLKRAYSAANYFSAQQPGPLV
jgi:hypothetical protein